MKSHHLSILVLVLCLSALAPSLAFLRSPHIRDPLDLETLLPVPQQSDWVDCGPILGSGIPGEWDFYLWGGFANAVVKKDGHFHLYYQGSRGYDEPEDTVTWRAIGVATSTDGVHFTKYELNPVLTWFPNNQFEEGAVSAGAYLEESGDIALYYGANTWAGGSMVNADGRLANSSDGRHFEDKGIVLDHSDIFIWGSGDELFPVAGIQDSGQWYLYYIPNGTPQRGMLGVAWGSDSRSLKNSAQALTDGNMVPVWGPASLVKVGNGREYVVFLNNPDTPGGPSVEGRLLTLNAPNQLSLPIVRYQFVNVRAATILLDGETNVWHMYYLSADFNYYGARIAVTDGRKMSCPGSRQYMPYLSSGVSPASMPLPSPALHSIGSQ